MVAAMEEEKDQDELFLTGKSIRISLTGLLLACDALEPVAEVFREFRPKRYRRTQEHSDVNIHTTPVGPVAIPSYPDTKKQRSEKYESNHESSSTVVHPDSCDSSVSSLSDFFPHCYTSS